MITCMGVLIMDMFPSEEGIPLKEVPLWRPVCGGAPANVAVANVRLGGHSNFIGKVGDDAFGQKLRDALKAEKVDEQGLLTDCYARTTMNFHAKPFLGEIEYCFYRNPGADTRIQRDEIDIDIISRSTFLHYDALCLTDEPTKGSTEFAVEIAKKNNTLISFDMNYRQPLWKNASEAVKAAENAFKSAEIIKINETEAELLVGTKDRETAAKLLLSLGAKLVLITLGKDGSFYATQGFSGFVPAKEIRAVNTIGCGDTFMAAVLNRLDCLNKGLEISQAEIENIFHFANTAAGLMSLKEGVFSAMPTLAEVENCISSEKDESSDQ